MIRFDESLEDLIESIGKKVHFVFVDGDEMDAVIDGFVSPADNGTDYASIDVITTDIPGIVRISEDEIKTVKLI